MLVIPDINFRILCHDYLPEYVRGCFMASPKVIVWVSGDFVPEHLRVGEMPPPSLLGFIKAGGVQPSLIQSPLNSMFTDSVLRLLPPSLFRGTGTGEMVWF